MREKLLATRLACVELANERKSVTATHSVGAGALRHLTLFRSALLDRILQLEINAGQGDQPPISGPLGTERELRFRDRIASALSQTTDLNSDPYTNSAHCGPAAMQEYQQKFANTSVHGDKSTGPEFDSTVGKGSPSKRPAGKISKIATVDDPTTAQSLVPIAPPTAPTSFTPSHPPESATSQPVTASTAVRIPKIRVKPITAHPAMNAPAHVPSSNSLSNLLDGNSTYRDSKTPSEVAPTAPDGSASS